jgi:hypothetical protein
MARQRDLHAAPASSLRSSSNRRATTVAQAADGKQRRANGAPARFARGVGIVASIVE